MNEIFYCHTTGNRPILTCGTIYKTKFLKKKGTAVLVHRGKLGAES